MNSIIQQMQKCDHTLETSQSLSDKFEQYKLGETYFEQGTQTLQQYKQQLDTLEIIPEDVYSFEQTTQEINILMEQIKTSNLDDCMKLYPLILSKVSGLELKMKHLEPQVYQVNDDLTEKQLEMNMES